MTDETIHTTRDADLRWAMCRCGTCGYTARCTPSDDFYGGDGEPLKCERCMMKGIGVTTPLMHMIPTTDNPERRSGKGWLEVTRERFAAFVSGEEKK